MQIPKVLHLITGLEAGGAETLLQTFVAHSRGRAFSHVVVSMTGIGAIGPMIRDAGTVVQTLEIPKGRPTVAGIVRLWQVVEEERPAVIQCWMYHANLLGTLVAVLRRVPHLWCLHAGAIENHEYGAKFRWTRRACAALSPLPNAIVANSEATRSAHQKLGFRARRWETIGNGVDTHRFASDQAKRWRIRRELGIPAEALVIGLFARFDPMKDHATFFRAAAILGKAHPEVHFVLAGAGVAPDNADIRAMSDEAALGVRLHLLGFRRDVADITSAIDIATSTSVFGESFSNTTAEAMACGVPCVVTNMPAVVSVVGDTGVIIPLRNPAALVAGWESILSLSPADRSSLGQRARERVERHFTIERMVDQFEALYNDLILPRRSPPLISVIG